MAIVYCTIQQIQKKLAEKILFALDKEWDYDKIGKYAERFKLENKAKDVLEVYSEIFEK